MAELHDWNIVDGYLIGRVCGHERFPDGTRVRTSRIRLLQGDWAQTENGSIYHLCERAAGLPGAIYRNAGTEPLASPPRRLAAPSPRKTGRKAC